MVWSTKYLGKERDYIVIKHRLSDIDGFIEGVKFRRGYGVVDKNSKAYIRLKKLPLIKDGLEFPIIHLKKLKFIIRNRDIETVYGKDVYIHFMNKYTEYMTVKNEQDRVEAENQHLSDDVHCKYRKDDGELCKNEVCDVSPSQYCIPHLFKDPQLESLNIKIPKMLTKDEKKELREKVIKKLTRMKLSKVF